jgi:hypothetical protein
MKSTMLVILSVVALIVSVSVPVTGTVACPADKIIEIK